MSDTARLTKPELALVIVLLPLLLLWVLFCGVGALALRTLAFVLRCLFLRRAARLLDDLAWELWA